MSNHKGGYAIFIKVSGVSCEYFDYKDAHEVTFFSHLADDVVLELYDIAYKERSPRCTLGELRAWVAARDAKPEAPDELLEHALAYEAVARASLEAPELFGIPAASWCDPDITQRPDYLGQPRVNAPIDGLLPTDEPPLPTDAELPAEGIDPIEVQEILDAEDQKVRDAR